MCYFKPVSFNKALSTLYYQCIVSNVLLSMHYFPALYSTCYVPLTHYFDALLLMCYSQCVTINVLFSTLYTQCLNLNALPSMCHSLSTSFFQFISFNALPSKHVQWVTFDALLSTCSFNISLSMRYFKCVNFIALLSTCYIQHVSFNVLRSTRYLQYFTSY
jgi:hypothetical protein